MRNSIWLLGAVLLTACGPAGVLSGKVTVEGGSAGGIAVIVYGPQSGATVTGDDGAFSIGNLPDGKYVVRATLRNADVEEVNATTTITNGKASPEPVLAFRSSTAKVTGRVVMADGSGAEQITVTATGPETRGVRTSAGGAFSFEGLKTGAYVISVEGTDTLEGRVGVGVNASGTIDAGELRLTPVGRFGGSVVFGTTPVEGAPVVVTGTSSAAVTDAMGRFTLVNVPTGMQAVQVRVGTAPFFRSGTVMVTVARGANADVPIVITDDAPKTGTVTGTVTFRGPRTPRDITISAPGSGVTATPQFNGAYSLALPVGSWDVMATAPQHPQKLLGRVTVTEGQSQAVPGVELSWFRPIWRSSSNISPPSPAVIGVVNDNVPWSLLTFFDSVQRLALVNSTTYDFRILAIGNVDYTRISKAGKYVAWSAGMTVFVYEIGTATISTFVTPAPVLGVEFSSDESALFIRRESLPTPVGVGTLTRIKFATPNAPEIFPATGGATDIQLTNADRWFVRDSTNAIRLVTPSIDVPSVFTQVTSFGAQPTAWALTNCNIATCEFWVLSPTSIGTAVRDTSVNPLGLNVFQSGAVQSRGAYPCFTQPATASAFCVKSADGTHYPLAAVPNTFRLNEAGDRVLWTFTGNTVLREEAMPPQASTTNLATTAVTWVTGWMSPTRAFAYESSGNPRSLRLIAAGMNTTDNDIGPQIILVRPPLLVFPQSSTSQWRAYVGNGAVRQLPVPTSTALVGVAVRGLGTGPTAVTKFAALTFGDTSSGFYVLDENMPALKQTFTGFAVGAAYRSGAIEYFFVNRIGAQAGFHVFNTSSLLECLEPAVAITTQIGAPGVQAWVGLGDDNRTIFVGSFQP